jgi:uroporphyrinogen decarboxylase
VEINSRSRVKAALERRSPDRVPIDLGGNQTGIHVKAYKNLLEHLGMADEPIVLSNFSQQLARPSDAMLERFHVDTRWVRPLANYIEYEKVAPQYEQGYIGQFDQFGVFWGNDASKDVRDILYYDPVIHPLENATTVHDVEEFSWPDGKNTKLFEGLNDVAKALHEKTPYAVCSTAVSNTFELCTFLFGFIRVMKLVRLKPELLDAAINELSQYWIDYISTYIGQIGKYIDVVCINSDLASQDGPLVNPTFYEQHVKPVDRKIVQHLKHVAPHVKINFHSCGSVPAFLPHFANLGYDSINPVQVSAYDMEPCSLKKRFGKYLSFWGGLCDSQHILPFGMPAQVREDVKKNMNCLKPGGGFIAANIHNITAEVPPENIVAMFDAAREFGSY